MIRTLLMILLLVATFSVRGQQGFFSLIYGDTGFEYASAVAESRDTTYIIAGATESFGNGQTDIVLFAINKSGNLIWQKAYGTSAIERATSIKAINDSTSFIVSGYTNNTPNHDYQSLILKIDINGDTIWQKNFNTSGWNFLNDILVLPDNSMIFCGTIHDNISTGADILVVKTDSNGNAIWSYSHEKVLDQEGTALILSYDGTIAVCGNTINENYNVENAYVLNLDTSGTVNWELTYNDSNENIAHAITLLQDNSILVAGEYDYQGNASHFQFLIDQGDTIFHVNIDYWHPGVESTKSILTLPNGSVLKAGETSSYGAGGLDFHLFNTDKFGIPLSVNSSATFGYAGDETLEDAIMTLDKGFLFLGTTYSTAGLTNILIIKTDSLLNYQPLDSINVVSTNEIPTLNHNFKLYPNPAKAFLNIQTGQINTPVLQIEIFDLQGRMVKKLDQGKMQHPFQVSLSDINSGSYLIRLVTEDRTFSRIFQVIH